MCLAHQNVFNVYVFQSEGLNFIVKGIVSVFVEPKLNGKMQSKVVLISLRMYNMYMYINTSMKQFKSS